MRRARLLLASMVAVMLLATGVAVAATLYGTSGNDVIYGTASNDTLNLFRNPNGTITKGSAGSDAVFGKGGSDTVYGGSGNDNYLNTAVDSSGNTKTAGLRGASGADKVYGHAGDDDVIGNDGNDNPLDDSSPSNQNDWDRAFGGTGNDTINVADGDTRDEVSCGENTDSPAGGTDDTDTVRIDVVRSSGQITAADTVYEYDANNNSTKCEVIKDKYGNVVTQDKLPQSADATASAEPSST